MCSICLNEFTDYKTLCGHEFHRSCLETWLLTEHTRKDIEQSLTCPLCRADIDGYHLFFGDYDATESLFGESYGGS
jgi:hypothetical protein